MSEGEDAGQRNVEDGDHHDHHAHHQQAPPESYPELSDDNPIENDVEHTTDEVPAEGQKSASADSGAEEVGSPEQQAIHGTGIKHSLATRWLRGLVVKAKFHYAS